eukprot:g28796.t3
MPDDDVHDLQFVKESLHEILKLPCIDKRRVHCTGYSNGARFCMRLASELSQVIASVAPVSGLRFPTPNQAIRPIPILAFHGDLDQVNPWNGHGEGYWQSSVPDAMQDWARFNGCRLASGAAPAAPQFIEAGSYAVASYSDCNGNATVELLLLHGAGHQWPGAMWPLPGLGAKSSVDANQVETGGRFDVALNKAWASQDSWKQRLESQRHVAAIVKCRILYIFVLSATVAAAACPADARSERGATSTICIGGDGPCFALQSLPPIHGFTRCSVRNLSAGLLPDL